MSIFPFLAVVDISPEQSLPLLQEWAFDFDAGQMLVTDGHTQRVVGMEALKVWMYKAINTAKGRFAAYSAEFGSELEDLIGGTYSPSAVQAEAARMVTEALLVSPYISAVTGVDADLVGDLLSLRCNVDTVYGSTEMEVSL